MGEVRRVKMKNKNKSPKTKTTKAEAPPSNDNLDASISDKKMQKVASNKKRKVTTQQPQAEPEPTQAVLTPSTTDKKKSKLKKKTKRVKQSTMDVDDDTTHDLNDNQLGDDSDLQTENLDVANSNKKTKKAARNKKRKGTELPEAVTTETVVSTTPDVHEGKDKAERRDKKKTKLKNKKRDKENRKKDGASERVSHSNDVQRSGSASQKEKGDSLFDDEDEVYEISSGDEDETTGMKRWITKYHGARPGAEVLSENIDDFLVDYWAQKEREKKEKEEAAAEGGWTVVTHNKGRKKTTDAESGTTVGSVAPAAVMDKLSKKKKDKQVGLNFYRFQKREAQRNEIMMLQSKFEQDKKRIQQLRAERKFRPY